MLGRRQLLAAPLAAGLSSSNSGGGAGFASAVALIDEAVRDGDIVAAVLHVCRGDRSWARAFGQAHDADAVFLLASLTKPMTAAGVMALVEAGKLALDAPVAARAPELLATAPSPEDRAARARITLRHLLSHTSGLPDMPPANQELRHRHAGLGEFLTSALSVPLAFAPGTRVRYQSMGFLLAAEIGARVAGRPWREHLRRAIFSPLGMRATSLGLGGRKLSATMLCQVPDEPGAWNSQYWRDLGSPWGGAHGNAADLARFLRSFARPERGPRALAVATVRAMLTPSPPVGGPGKGDSYGLGFRLGAFAKASSPRTFGHGGATGVVAWHDPEADLTCVFLTTRPAADNRWIGEVSNLIADAPPA